MEAGKAQSPRFGPCIRCGVKFTSSGLFPCIVKGQRYDYHEFIRTSNSASEIKENINGN